jgi:hypothetical protein
VRLLDLKSVHSRITQEVGETDNPAQHLHCPLLWLEKAQPALVAACLQTYTAPAVQLHLDCSYQSSSNIHVMKLSFKCTDSLRLLFSAANVVNRHTTTLL